MPVPTDVTVTRQVLAEPDATLSDSTWATLADGTPLVTAARRGKGLIVLFHVTGDTRWSDLPLSGTFVDMLKRIVDFGRNSTVAQAESAQSGASTGSGCAEPRARWLRRLRFSAADGAAGADRFRRPRHSRSSAGLLWSAGRICGRQRARAADRLKPLDFSPIANAHHEVYRTTAPLDLRGPVFLAALALFLLDSLVVLFFGGGSSD